MKKVPVIVGILLSVSFIALGFVGIFNSNNDIEFEKPSDKPVVLDYDINKLYNYVKGFSYKYISLDESTPSYYYSDLHQEYVTADMLSNEVIIRGAIKQIVTCDGIYANQIIPYDVVVSKVKEITGRDIQFDLVSVSMTMGESEASYICDINGCMPVGGSYCSTMPLTSDYIMVSHKLENNNVVIIDKDNNNQYQHIFTKDSSGNYYWVSSSILRNEQ